jgi:fumarylacetoacetase
LASSEMLVDETHDPQTRSWIESADGHAQFPIQNLPMGVFSTEGLSPRIGVAIGDSILDLRACVEEGFVDAGQASEACRAESLNDLMALDARDSRRLRAAIHEVLREGTPAAERVIAVRERVVVAQSEARMFMPADIGDYTDFYASIHHATNVGRMFRPDNPLLPNYKHVPIGYHGRASSIVASGTAVRRPNGQTKPADAESPSFGPSKLLDYESELGFFIRRGNAPGDAIAVGNASDYIFGFCLVNDWSARDIQTWEYQPLGPFLSKSFATTVSPWVVTSEAVAPYRVRAAARPVGDPEPLEYLREADSSHGALNAFLEVRIQTARMRGEGIAPVMLSRAPFSTMYWTVSQMVAHHTSNGCNLRPGDLLASGTVSGDSEDSRGCLLELTMRGAKPVTLPTGEVRRFLEDGDEVIMTGSLESPGRPAIGFGECRGTILPANQ